MLPSKSARTSALNAKPYTRPTQRKTATVSPFQKAVYGIVKQVCSLTTHDHRLGQIPSGSISTYGTIAKHLHTSSQAVGNALRNNPYAPVVPCHRVVATDGKLRGFFGEWVASCVWL